MNSNYFFRCEVGQGTQGSSTESTASSPQILYDLIGTVNHCGNLHQGHYVSNVKVSNRWYGCNDAFVQIHTNARGWRGQYLLGCSYSFLSSPLATSSMLYMRLHTKGPTAPSISSRVAINHSLPLPRITCLWARAAWTARSCAPTPGYTL